VVPNRVCKIYFVDVSFDCLDHEGQGEGVICPVVDSIVDEYLFVGFDITGGTEVQAVAFGVPPGIFSAFVERVVGISS